MRCPKCGNQDDKVIDSREGATIRRRLRVNFLTSHAERLGNPRLPLVEGEKCGRGK